MMNTLQSTAIELLNQLKSLTNQLDASTYTHGIAALSQASIGQHVRHTLELFQCLTNRPQGIVNYDLRKRNTTIEQNPLAACEAINKIKRDLQIDKEDFDLLLEANYTTDPDTPIQLTTSYYRELAYNIEHAIHHMALMKAGIKSLQLQINLPDHFGVASSTIRYQKSLQN